MTKNSLPLNPLLGFVGTDSNISLETRIVLHNISFFFKLGYLYFSFINQSL